MFFLLDGACFDTGLPASFLSLMQLGAGGALTAGLFWLIAGPDGVDARLGSDRALAYGDLPEAAQGSKAG